MTLYTVVTSGFTVIEAVVAPLPQTKLTPPEALKVVDSPKHISNFPLITGEGKLFTITFSVADALHPFSFVTVT